MENNDYKCKVNGHKQEKFEFICFNPICQEKNKFFCMECATDSDHFFKEKQQLLRISNLFNSQKPHFDIWKDVDTIIKEFYSQAQQDQNNNNNDECLKLENYLNQIKQRLNNIIDEMIKNLKSILQKHLKDVEQNKLDIQNRIESNYDINELKQIIQKFQNGEFQQNIASQQIFEFQQQQLNSSFLIVNEIKNLMKYIKPTFYEHFFNDILSDQKKLFDEIESSILKQSQCLNKWDNIEFYQGQHFGSDIRFIFDQNSQTMKNLNMCEFFSTSFKKQQKIKFSFKILEDPRSPQLKDSILFTDYLFFGVNAKRLDNKYDFGNWGDSGNQFCMLKKQDALYSKKQFQVLGKKPQEIYNVGNEYEAIICIEENQMIIYDSMKRMVLINKHEFEKQYEDWVLIFYSHTADKKIQILKAEIS